MDSQSQRNIRIVWKAEPDSGWADDYYTGILVRDNGALYHNQGSACLAIVAPTETDGLYRIDDDDVLPLITRDPLEDVARLLNEMSALDYLLKVMPVVMLPDAMPI
ncbi:hypothetical protein [Paenibacillus odorifer]|uniref:Uncharacterized protein n=1 Tax=Paenibacillus odorifer TaxID=189426 RepID=A0A1R0XEQ8_9BACL|nr:hypothetical protein [Paenibacillus odorifer]OMD33561.1 hypothetical protein BJP51_12310 [Paenibacillus odorifer]